MRRQWRAVKRQSAISAAKIEGRRRQSGIEKQMAAHGGMAAA